MKKLFETLRNINKIEELRNRILYTLGIILIYRLGSYITCQVSIQICWPIFKARVAAD